MKSLKIAGYIGIAALAGIGVALAVTNPNQSAYEQYAVQRLTEYLKVDVCRKAPDALGGLLKRNCSILVDSTRPQLQQIIAQKTRRQNYILFSIYSTDLSINQLLPAYYFESVGAFQNFYTYKAEEQ